MVNALAATLADASLLVPATDGGGSILHWLLVQLVKNATTNEQAIPGAITDFITGVGLGVMICDATFSKNEISVDLFSDPLILS